MQNYFNSSRQKYFDYEVFDFKGEFENIFVDTHLSPTGIFILNIFIKEQYVRLLGGDCICQNFMSNYNLHNESTVVYRTSAWYQYLKNNRKRMYSRGCINHDSWFSNGLFSRATSLEIVEPYHILGLIILLPSPQNDYCHHCHYYLNR